MAITHADFFRMVQPLLAGEDCTIHEDGVSIRRGDASIDIRLGPEGRRRLGNFSLPRTQVEIRLRNCPPDAAAAFLAAFDTRFRRGGG